MKQPGLGVKPRAGGVVRHAHLRAEFDRRLERLGFGGPRVGRGEDAQRLPFLDVASKHF